MNARIRQVLFNTEMVTAILEERKTATRRLVKPQPERDMKYKLGYCISSTNRKDIGKFGFGTSGEGGHILCVRPPVSVGDILYVRETWGISNLDSDDNTACIVYKASANEKDEGCRAVRFSSNKFDKLYDSMAESSPDWRPSIHMPKEAARIWLKVTDVRVERLQDMTQVDFIMEGINTCKRCSCKDLCMGLSNARICYLKSDFIKIWESTIKETDIGKYGWKANPWVWAIEFARIEKPEGWCV